MTFSALPDCLCARLPGSLSHVEAVVLLAHSGGISVAAGQWCPDSLDFRGARRWVRRRVQLVEVELKLFQSLLPQLFAELASGCVWGACGCSGCLAGASPTAFGVAYPVERLRDQNLEHPSLRVLH